MSDLCKNKKDYCKLGSTVRENTKTGSKKRNNGAGGLADFFPAQSGAPNDYFLLNIGSEEQISTG